jgi:hypothetical protein
MNKLTLTAIALAVGVGGMAGIGAVLFRVPEFKMNPQPSGSFEESLRMFDSLQEKESQLPLGEAGPSRLFHHGRKTDRAFVLMHGLTNCPEQFVPLAKQLHAAGYNVILPRARLAGFKDRLNGEQGQQTAQDLIDQAAIGLDIAAGLGDHVTLVGLSGSAVAATWTAQNRDGIDDLMVMAPFFSMHGKPAGLIDTVAVILSWLPNFYLWWDPVKKDAIPGPAYAYPRFGTRCMADSIQLSRNIRSHLQERPLRSKRAIFVTTAIDEGANNEVTASIVDSLSRQNGSTEIIAHEFPAAQAIPHDMIDPAQPGANTPLVYKTVLDLLKVEPASSN